MHTTTITVGETKIQINCPWGPEEIKVEGNKWSDQPAAPNPEPHTYFGRTTACTPEDEIIRLQSRIEEMQERLDQETQAHQRTHSSMTTRLNGVQARYGECQATLADKMKECDGLRRCLNAEVKAHPQEDPS